MKTYQMEMKPTTSLIPYVNNPRTHSEDQVRRIAGSILEFGFTNPVLIDEDLGVIAGHGRLQAAIKLDLDEVPCITVTDLTKAQKKALVIADNKIALTSDWDLDLLQAEIDSLNELDFDLDVVGFTKEELEVIFPSESEQIVDPTGEWEDAGMPECENEDLLYKHKVTINFDSLEDKNKFAELIGIQLTDKTKSVRWPYKPMERTKGTAYVSETEESE